MATVWFILIALTLSVYVALDGFDLGAGAIYLVVAHSDAERRQILRAIGPVWDGNEVWLIAAAGTLVFTFPVLYASSFSGFYLPLIMVLWLLMLRGVAIELRSHVPNPVWVSFWDGTFFLGSTLLCIFFGAALGNVIRGVSLNAHGIFFEPLWTTFSPFSAQTGILDWYTVLVGVLALAALVMHGANYVALKTEGPLNARSRQMAWRAWFATIALTVVVTITTFIVQPAMGAGFSARPWGYVFPLIALAGLAGAGYFALRRDDLRAFLSSGVYLLGMLASPAAGLYPLVLPAKNPANSLTIHNAAASQYALTVGLIWWSISILLAVIYFVSTYRLFRGKVQVKEGEGY